MRRRNRCVVAIGSFDGVHRGHALVVRETVRRARASGLSSLILTFDRPPRFVLKPVPGPRLLSTPLERERLLRSLGADRVAVLHFSKSFSLNTPKRFLEHHLLGRYEAAGLVVGPDFRFGHDRAGSLETLKRWGARGLNLWPVPFAQKARHKLSSRAIRKLLSRGRVEEAESQLGHPYLAFGRVVRGAGVGRRLGFPTANLRTDPDKILPPGVFAVRVFTEPYRPRWGGKARGGGGRPGICNIGVRPTLGAGRPRPSFEVHLLDRAGSLYGKGLWVEFVKRLRPERRFSSLAALCRQIERDVLKARRLFTSRAE